MKNLIPYNLFEMAKLNIQDYIKDIEHIRDSVDYFNSKYNKIELNDKILNVDFKLPGNNGLSARLFGIAAVADDNEYNIIRLRIVESPNIKLYWVAYYLIVDSDCNLIIYYQLSGGKSSRIIFLSKISINLLKDRDKLIKVMFDNIKDHNESLNEMAKYETEEIVEDIKRLVDYAEHNDKLIQKRSDYPISGWSYYSRYNGLSHDIQWSDKSAIRLFGIQLIIRTKGFSYNKFDFNINFSNSGILIFTIESKDDRGNTLNNQAINMPYMLIKDPEKCINKFIDWCNEKLIGNV